MLSRVMGKVSVVFMCLVLLMIACNKVAPVIPPLPPDSTAPSLDYPFTSFASTTKFIPFGDTLPDLSLNKGYEVQLSDTNESIIAACGGIVSSITPDAEGSNFIAIKFKRNSIYSFLYGGVTRLAIHVNDSLRGGSIMGKVGSTGIIDFHVIVNNNEVLCPQTFGSPGFNTAIAGAISKNNLFHPVDTLTTPCLAPSMPE